jgi:Oxygenase domain of the 2OGFeDO superfamily
VIDLRLRTKVADQAMQDLAGKVLGPADYDVLLTGRTFVRMPDGRPLACYLPGALAEATAAEGVYEVLHSLRSYTSENRGLASGTRRLHRGSGEALSARTDSMPIASAIVGAVDPIGQQRYCRLTAWTGRNLPAWETLHPLLRAVAAQLAEHVPDRYAAQAGEAGRTDPAWVVPGTPFSTVTVNNTYPTGVHTDKGDLDAGFSTITCLRRGEYSGGILVFPQYRVAADLHDGDLILMDAHQWHGNTVLTCACGTRPNGPCEACGAERISLVAYFRTKVAQCGSPDEEHARAVANADNRSKLHPA